MLPPPPPPPPAGAAGLVQIPASWQAKELPSKEVLPPATGQGTLQLLSHSLHGPGSSSSSSSSRSPEAAVAGAAAAQGCLDSKSRLLAGSPCGGQQLCGGDSQCSFCQEYLQCLRQNAFTWLCS
jgi:hypothetical protein